MPTKVIDNADSVREVVQEVTSRNKIPLIFIDLEGENLSRHGSIAIVSVLIPPNPTIYLLDVHELQSRAFDTAAAGGLTWRSILESEEHPKVFFDVRNDSDALYSHFSIALRGVVDLQLLEFATRPGRGRYVKGLSKCILESSFLSAEERSSWRRGKDEGIKQFAPEHGGTYRVFFKRPLSTALQSYCAEDVLKLPGLLSAYSGTIKPHLAAQVGEEALHRVTLSQGVYFNGKGKHMAVGPDFTWTMPSIQPDIGFPMSLVCSADLKELCFLDDLDSPRVLGFAASQPVNDTPPHKSLAVHETSHVAGSALGETCQVGAEPFHGHGHKNYDLRTIRIPLHEYNNDYDSDKNKDFAACSAEDCGYCGHCGY